MATKPTETLNFEPSAVVVIPSGKQAVGFQPGERPPAQYINWLFRIFSRLYNYVVDGNFTGNHTIAGTLGVTGATTITGTMAVSGASTLTGGVANNLVANAGITVPTGQSVAIQGTSSLSVGGAASFGGAAAIGDTLTMALDKNIVLSGAGRIVDAWERTERFHAASMSAGSSGSANGPLTADGREFGSGVQGVYYGIQLPVGATITGFGCDFTQNVTGTNTNFLRLYRLFIAGGIWVSGTLDETPASSAGSGAKSVSIASLSRVVSASEYYVLSPLPASGTGTSRIHGGYITWHP